MVPGRFGWEDVGDFAVAGAHSRRLTTTASGSWATSHSSSTSDASGLVVPARPVAWSPWSALDDVVVVDTGDALLVTSYQKAQDVKAVVDELRRRGRTDLT